MTDEPSGSEHLITLKAGMPILFGGDRVTHVSRELAASFVDGDRLVVVQDTGDLLLIPAADHALATAAVTRGATGFSAMG
ncbi:MAG: glutamate-5-semialdehyde dehydrogenase, partial [Glaciecola sp.]